MFTKDHFGRASCLQIKGGSSSTSSSIQANSGAFAALHADGAVVCWGDAACGGDLPPGAVRQPVAAPVRRHGLRGTLSRRRCLGLGPASHWRRLGRCTARATRHRRYPSQIRRLRRLAHGAVICWGGSACGARFLHCPARQACAVAAIQAARKAFATVSATAASPPDRVQNPTTEPSHTAQPQS